MNDSNNQNKNEISWRKKIGWMFLGVFLFCFLAVSLFLYGSFRLLNQAGSHLSSAFRLGTSTLSEDEERPSNNMIGVIEIEGIIFDSKKIIERLHKAEKDPNIKAIVLRINSPGGAVAPSQEIYQEILRLDQKKPIYASFSTVAASGGYYIGSAARKIFASPGTLTGSIGVIMEFVNLEKAMEFLKVKSEIIKAGKYKDAGHPHRSITSEERGLMEGVLSQVHRQFIDDILKTRSQILRKPIAELAQGQIFSGEEAQKLGLVDSLGGLWEAARFIHEEQKLPGEVRLYYIKDKKKLSLSEIMNTLEDSAESLQNVANKISSQGPTPLFLATP